jgi:hypothetical protein
LYTSALPYKSNQRHYRAKELELQLSYGYIAYDLLEYYFEPGDKYHTLYNGVLVRNHIVYDSAVFLSPCRPGLLSIAYTMVMTRSKPCYILRFRFSPLAYRVFYLDGETTSWDGHKYINKKKNTFSIPQYDVCFFAPALCESSI